jgi:hypothetical protein
MNLNYAGATQALNIQKTCKMLKQQMPETSKTNFWRHDTQQKDIQHNDSQSNDTKLKGLICDSELN